MDLCSSARECELMEVIRKRVCGKCDVAWVLYDNDYDNVEFG